MINNNNIDDIFKNAFKDNRVKPSEQTWAKINKKLFVQNISNAFKSFKVKPSTKVWVSLNKKLFWLKFLKFNFKTFNIYYAGTTIILLFLVIFNYNNINKNLQFKTYNTKKSEPKNKYYNKLLSDKNVNKKNIENKTIKKYNTKKSEPKNKYYNKLLSDKNVNKKNIENKTINEHNNYNISLSKNIKHNNIEKNKIKYIKLPKLKPYPIDSLEQIINPDTIATDAFNNPIIFDKSNWYFDIITSLGINDFLFSNLKAETNYVKTLDKATTPDYLYSGGIRLCYKHKSWTAKTGISFTKLNEKFNYNYTSTKIDTSYYYNVFNSGYTKYDTIMFLNLDYLLETGDSIYSPYVSETWVETTDSTLKTKLDTTNIKEKLNTKNIYNYIEIPLILGYKINRYKFTYSLNAGIITGIFIKSKGFTIQQNNLNNIIDISTAGLPYIKFNYSLIINTEICYKINKKLHLLVEPFYRQSINSLFNKNYLYSKKNKAYGLTIGLRYIIK